MLNQWGKQKSPSRKAGMGILMNLSECVVIQVRFPSPFCEGMGNADKAGDLAF